MAAYFTMIEYGDTVLGMELSHGGHLTHGSPVNFSGKAYKFISYGLNCETERIDYAELEKIAIENRPKLIVAGASAYPRIIDFERLRRIADLVGAHGHFDHAQDAEGTARRVCVMPQRPGACTRFSGFPPNAGRPAHARGSG